MHYQMQYLIQHLHSFSRLLILFVIQLLLLPTALAETSVWSVTNGKNTIYIGGTIHLLKPEHYPLPKEFDQAYDQVKWLVFETDISKVEDPAFMQQFSQAMLLPAGDSLDKHLSKENMQAIQQWAAKNQIPTANLMHLRPQMIALMISMGEIKKLGFTAQGVDSYYNEKAIKDGKITSQLESLEQQLNFLVNMATDNEDSLISQTFKDLARLDSMIKGLEISWQKGDRQGLFEHGLKEMITETPEVYRDLVKLRNDNWMPVIENLIKHPEKKFVLVGSLHLIGEDGLLPRLEKKGYTVKQL